MRADRSSCLKRILPIALACSQASSAGAQRYLVHQYTEQDGLPVSEVGDVEQDRDGNLWCATRAGIVLYDGSTWQPLDGPGGAPIRDVQSLRFDSLGRCWIVRRNGSILVGTAQELAPFPANQAMRGRTDFVQDWDLLERDGGERLAVTTIEHDVFFWDGDTWRELGEVADLVGTVRAVEAAHGRFYVCGDAGLVALEADGATFAPLALPTQDKAVRGVFCDRSGDAERVWVQGPDWLGLLDAGRVELAATGVPEPKEVDVQPLVHAPDGAGGLYYGNAVGLYHFDRGRGTVERLGAANGLVAEGALGLLLDGEGLVWIGTRLGISKLVSKGWLTYGAADGLLRGETSALEQLPDGRIALGHNGGLTLHERGRFEPVALARELPADLGSSRILDLDVDAHGNLWAAASGLGLGRLAPDGTWSWFLVPEKSWAAAVLCSRDGSVWVGTSKGLAVLDGDAVRSAGVPELTGQYVRFLVETPAGGLAAGAENGLWLRDGKTWRQAHAPTASEANGIFSILVDHGGGLWVGARDGLWHLSGQKLGRPGFKLPRERQVYTLVEDAARRLWIGTDFGVYRWNGAELEHFTVRDGLSGNETNRAAGFVDARGDVWLGTEKGLSIFRPGLERRDAPPEVELVAVEIDGELRDPQLELELGAGSHAISFRARARTLVDEHALRWRTRLEGFSQEWTEREGDCVLEVRHASLPAGRYRFLVEARRGERSWGRAASSGYLTVVGPFWTRPWFFILAALATAGIGATWHRFASQRRYARELEREVRRRSEELAAYQGELARSERLRSLGLLAGGIAHDFNNVLAALMGSLSLLRLRVTGRRDCDTLLDRADDALNRGKQLSTQLLTFAKGGEPVKRVVSLAQLVDDSTRLALSGSAVRADRDLPADLWPVRVDAAQICQTIENLLVNACQSMPAGGSVRLRARNVDGALGHEAPRPGRFVSLEVSDDGPGIPAEVLPRVFEPFFTTKHTGSGLGLATALSVVERHGGKLSVQSPPGSGATFTLVLPAASGELVAAEAPAPAQRAAPRPGRALVMDDDADVRALLAEILATLGWETTSVANGEEALAALATALSASKPFRCAILDLTVPGGCGGVAALPRLRKLDPDLPALATSGYTEDAVMSRPLDFGFQGALPKPFRVADVAAALENLELDTVA